MLFRSLNDARYSYTFCTSVYSGKPTGEPTRHYITGPEEVVKYLVTEMEQHGQLRGRNLTIDRLYTSLPLTQWLFDRGITVMGTIQNNRKGIPAEMKSTQGRDEHSYKVAWQKENKNITLHSYVVNTKSSGTKNVLLITTMKPILGVTKDDGKQKPAALKLYDYTKGGTDIVDQRAMNYTCKPKSNRWTIVAISFLLDTCRVNASTILALNQRNDPRKVDSFDFGFTLAEELTRPFIQQRSLNGLPTSVTQKIHRVLGMPEQQPPQPDLMGVHR
ncbi:piggyBac transposable element-derived protein 1-like [Lytechinus variegatus]|uniref:piggyBac transposable element-derived protein 1-like n=1 Tax=Lytechinus variegatus TaxID=7654 RepID=UPI001BB209F6|nr:piggyBac transposable element-derived protein 1-like [Lytechinus variegatus]